MANRNEKEASRKRILSTCVRLFLEQGFKHTPPKQILTEADVSAGTFYNLYRTKAGVLTELTEFMFQNQFTIAGQIAQGENRSRKTLRGGDGDSADAGRTEREPAPNLRGSVQRLPENFGNHPQDDGRDAAPYFRRVYARVQCERFL